jgi:alpha-ketoglutarate-dependent taurine dioxygenase
MNIKPQADQKMGARVTGLDLSGASRSDVDGLRAAIYQYKILIVENQEMTPAQFVQFGRALGAIETYYEPMYHHPEYKEIFVSATRPERDRKFGVPQTGKFWHHDYSFMPKPFGITITFPQIVPRKNRGTYYIDMGRVFSGLPEDLKASLRRATGEHSPRRYFKIRPSDVYRPVKDLLEEIEKTTPPAFHPAVFTHPVTGEEVLYVSEAATCNLLGENGQPLDDGSELLRRALEASGQYDDTFTNPNIHTQWFTKGDLLIWDNRSLVHRALHTTKTEPAVSYRLTVHDSHPFYPAVA